MRSEPPPFVLVHGGRHGGWCWCRVTPRLRAAGHDVFTPTLTGLGERAHLLGPHVGLETHIRDLIAVFEYEDIADALLVGHSYGAMVISGAMDFIWHRVRRVVVLDGHLPLSGESVFDIIGQARASRMRALAAQHGEGWYIPPTDASHYGVLDPDDAAWMNLRLTAQPLKTYQDPVGSTDRAWRHPTTFIQCSGTSLEPHVLERARERSTVDSERFLHVHLDAPHAAMVTAAPALSELLREAAQAPRPSFVEQRKQTPGVVEIF